MEHNKCSNIFIICLLCLFSSVFYAQNVDRQTAWATACSFFGKKIPSNNDALNNSVRTIVGKRGIALYVIEFDECGWALVSADKRLRPILAYSKNGKFPTDDEIPPAMYDLLYSYTAEIDFAKDSIDSSEIHPEWLDNRTTLSTTYVIVDDLLQRGGKKVIWKQHGNASAIPDCSKVYNKYCPTFTTNSYSPCPNHAYVGCSAVAMGQVMWYWQWPYYAKVPQTMVDSLGTTSGNTMHEYDWNLMPNKLENSSSLDMANMVACLLRDCGYSVKINYGVSGSGATMSDIAKALKNNFGYSSSLYYTTRPSKLSQLPNWINLLKTELDNGRPIIYAGYVDDSNDAVGHAFILTGYDSRNYFSVNWGWGYIDTAFYSITSLIPISNNNFEFNYKQKAIIGIEPAPICSSQIPTTQSTWAINLVELYHGNHTIQNTTYDSTKRGIIYSDGTIRITGNVRFEQGSDIHIAIRNMYCNNNKDDIIEKYSAPFRQEDKNLTDKHIYIVPNPVNDILTVVTESEIDKVSLYNLNGICIMQTKDKQINVSSLSNGIYVISVLTKDNETYQSKFVKQ